MRMRERKRGVEAGVWPWVHEKWRMVGWFTSQYWRDDIIIFIFYFYDYYCGGIGNWELVMSMVWV